MQTSVGRSVFTDRSTRGSSLTQSALNRRPFNISQRKAYIKTMSVATERVFRISDRASLRFKKGNLVEADTDAIVNAANERMLGGGGVDGAIHRAAGPYLLQHCRDKVSEISEGVRCRTGDAIITPGFNLKAKNVIHAVGPVYINDATSAPLLYSAYKRALDVANENLLRSVAFPAISTGVYGYPRDEAARVSLKAIKENVGRVASVDFYLSDDAILETYATVAECLFPNI